eukprot:TRINITY_DN3397_c0_g1_i5.p1 TRINITY_DN3397_c0_g1~~TRINITY_DN3397_c0_g1_i5.p1  ORF type:complete len:505 (+),score=57.50 TRINITY_DN3397_c0_g1_i5:93-1607(+)
MAKRKLPDIVLDEEDAPHQHELNGTHDINAAEIMVGTMLVDTKPRPVKVTPSYIELLVIDPAYNKCSIMLKLVSDIDRISYFAADQVIVVISLLSPICKTTNLHLFEGAFLDLQSENEDQHTILLKSAAKKQSPKEHLKFNTAFRMLNKAFPFKVVEMTGREEANRYASRQPVYADHQTAAKPVTRSESTAHPIATRGETPAAKKRQVQTKMNVYSDDVSIVNQNKVLEYRFPKSSRDVVTITEDDLTRLKPGEFLNDNLIWFYMKYLQSLQPPSRLEMFHCMNTFFYRQLADNGVAKVASWVKDVNIFKKRFFLIPINDALHWSLLIVMNPGTLIIQARGSLDPSRSIQPPPRQVVDGEVCGRLKTPCIWYLDSMTASTCMEKGPCENYAAGVRNFLNAQALRLYPDLKDILPGAAELFTLSSLPSATAPVPQQPNGCDCGVYMLQFAESFFSHPAITHDGVCLSHTHSLFSSSLISAFSFSNRKTGNLTFSTCDKSASLFVL